jgi:uncharacterized protein YbjT (DUF2867 family)
MQKGKDVILVTGATGNQGGAVARELLSGGHKVRAMTRKPEGEGAKALAGLGAEVVQGDLGDAASLERALDGAWGAFAVQSPFEGGVEQETEQGIRLADLAKETGLQHFVYSSVGSAHRATGIPHFDSKWKVEERIRELDLPSYTILRPVFFMDNFVSPWFKPAIDEGNVALAIKPETRLQMIAVKDIGRYGALAFEKHAELAGKAIDIAGDEKTGPEAAEIIGRAAGKSLGFFPVPIGEMRKMSEDFALMFEWFDRVGYDADIEANGKTYAVTPTSLEEWAKGADWS